MIRCDFCEKERDHYRCKCTDWYNACKQHNHLKKYSPVKRFGKTPRKIKKLINKLFKKNNSINN